MIRTGKSMSIINRPNNLKLSLIFQHKNKKPKHTKLATAIFFLFNYLKTCINAVAHNGQKTQLHCNSL